MQDLEYKATDSIMFYRDVPSDHIKIGENHKCFAVHWSRKDGEWGKPKPLSDHELIDLTKGSATAPKILPENILWYEDGKQMIWYAPPCRHKFYYGDKEKPSVMMYNHPGLIFRVRDGVSKGRLSIAVVGTPFIRDAYTPILESPYDGHSVGNYGAVGTCGVKVPKQKYTFDISNDVQSEWERCFYLSKFSRRPRRRNLLKPTTTTLIEWMQNEF